MNLRQKIIECINAGYDLRVFLKYSFKVGNLTRKNHFVAYLTKQYHTIEKGLALPHVRLGFGSKKIYDVINVASEYISRFGDDELIKNIISVLDKYVRYHNEKHFKSDLIEDIKVFIENRNSITATGGVRNYVESDLPPTAYEAFVKGRASVRNFKNTPVSQDKILKAIEIAKHTPSVCNRQGWKLHIYNKADVPRLLALQNGNRGFEKSIKTIAVVTGDVQFFSNNERNQVGIDSGMFAMSLILAFYSIGIGTCALNTCVSVRSEVRIKKAANIPEHEKVIMYMALGYPSEDCVVAKSLRRDNESFVTFH